MRTYTGASKPRRFQVSVCLIAQDGGPRWVRLFGGETLADTLKLVQQERTEDARVGTGRRLYRVVDRETHQAVML